MGRRATAVKDHPLTGQARGQKGAGDLCQALIELLRELTGSKGKASRGSQRAREEGFWAAKVRERLLQVFMCQAQPEEGPGRGTQGAGAGTGSVRGKQSISSWGGFKGGTGDQEEKHENLLPGQNPAHLVQKLLKFPL